jgi:hypothetical protein
MAAARDPKKPNFEIPFVSDTEVWKSTDMSDGGKLYIRSPTLYFLTQDSAATLAVNLVEKRANYLRVFLERNRDSATSQPLTAQEISEINKQQSIKMSEVEDWVWKQSFRKIQ